MYHKSAERSTDIHCIKCSFLPHTYSLKKSLTRDKSSVQSVIFKTHDYTYINNVDVLNTLQYIIDGSELKKNVIRAGFSHDSKLEAISLKSVSFLYMKTD